MHSRGVSGGSCRQLQPGHRASGDKARWCKAGAPVHLLRRQRAASAAAAHGGRGPCALGDDDGCGPSTSGRSCRVGSVDRIDAEWAAFPKPGLGRFYRPSAAPLTPTRREGPLGAASPAASAGCAAEPCYGAAAPAPVDATCCWDPLLAREHPEAAAACEQLPQWEEVYVLLFGAERGPESEGIYSLTVPGRDGLPVHTVLAFESSTDAERYCGLAEAAMRARHRPTVCGLPPLELAVFCRDHAYQCRLERAGSLLMPPDTNVPMTDWERSLRLRQGTGFRVLEEEPPVPVRQAGADSSSGPQAAAAASPPTCAPADQIALLRSLPLGVPMPLEMPLGPAALAAAGQVLPGPGDAAAVAAAAAAQLGDMAATIAMLEAPLPPGGSLDLEGGGPLPPPHSV